MNENPFGPELVLEDFWGNELTITTLPGGEAILYHTGGDNKNLPSRLFLNFDRAYNWAFNHGYRE